jgi:hypothetical protein
VLRAPEVTIKRDRIKQQPGSELEADAGNIKIQIQILNVYFIYYERTRLAKVIKHSEFQN